MRGGCPIPRDAKPRGRPDPSRRVGDRLDTERDIDGSPLKTGEQVAHTVRVRVARGELQPGDRLPPEDELMAALGLARTTVREGLRILESQGLIEVRRGRGGGGRVTHPSVERLAQGLALALQLQAVTFGDLADASSLIEPALAGRLAASRTQEDLEALTVVVDRAAAAAKHNDPAEFARAATKLHETVVTRAGNTTLATVSRMLHELRSEYYWWASHEGADRKQFERAVRSYRKLVRLIVARDVAGAEDHWRKQLSYTGHHSDRSHSGPIPFI